MKQTPKEKAIELANRFYQNVMIEAISFNMYDEDSYNQEENYLREVKQEIEKL